MPGIQSVQERNKKGRGIVYKLFNFNKYNIIRKTCEGTNQTKMEGGTGLHLSKTDDLHRRVLR